jgi:hypothetical protein
MRTEEMFLSNQLFQGGIGGRLRGEAINKEALMGRAIFPSRRGFDVLEVAIAKPSLFDAERPFHF